MSQTHAIAATFEDTASVYHAAEKVRDAGYSRWDVISPFPIHGINGAMGLKRSWVGLFTLIGGFTGFWTGTFIVWFTNAFDYPLIVGGKPFFSFVYPFPVMYELTILLAAFGTLAGMFILNQLPRPHHPIMDHPDWGKMLDDKFMIVIEAGDPKFSRAATEELLLAAGGQDIAVITEEEDEEETPAHA